MDAFNYIVQQSMVYLTAGVYGMSSTISFAYLVGIYGESLDNVNRSPTKLYPTFYNSALALAFFDIMLGFLAFMCLWIFYSPRNENIRIYIFSLILMLLARFITGLIFLTGDDYLIQSFQNSYDYYKNAGIHNNLTTVFHQCYTDEIVAIVLVTISGIVNIFLSKTFIKFEKDEEQLVD